MYKLVPTYIYINMYVLIGGVEEYCRIYVKKTR